MDINGVVTNIVEGHNPIFFIWPKNENLENIIEQQ
jgi:hypothetical protein